MPGNGETIGRVVLDSSDQELVAGFRWAREQALAYAYSGDPVGLWYEAALPGRAAFCMRDVAHQSLGAHVLGLQAHTQNMLGRFAENITASRDWCTYWEISKENVPHPVDYSSDADFWYNLPANFDLLDCCYRQYLWTGDRTYIDHPVFLHYYDRTVTDYVTAWDRDGDGVPEHLPRDGRRGIGSYNEGNLDLFQGGDLLAAQFAAYRAYAALQAERGATAVAAAYAAKAAALQATFNTTWWDEARGSFYGARLRDGTFYPHYHDVSNFMTLYFGLVEPGRKLAAALDDLLRYGAEGVEGKSHLPEILYRYGRHAAADAILRELVDPAQERREYPEVAFSVVGTLAALAIGISPEPHGSVATRARLTEKTEWIRIENVPVRANEIAVTHTGSTQTTLVNQRGATLSWHARFAGAANALLVDGVSTPATVGHGAAGEPESSVLIAVPAAARRTVAVPERALSRTG